MSPHVPVSPPGFSFSESDVSFVWPAQSQSLRPSSASHGTNPPFLRSVTSRFVSSSVNRACNRCLDSMSIASGCVCSPNAALSSPVTTNEMSLCSFSKAPIAVSTHGRLLASPTVFARGATRRVTRNRLFQFFFMESNHDLSARNLYRPCSARMPPGLVLTI